MRVGAIAAALVLCSVSGAAATPTRPTEKWRLDKTFGPQTWGGTDTAVAVASDDVWVFRSRARDFEVWVPTAYHWNGSTWTKAPLPKGLKGKVNGAVGRSSSDIWATVNGDQEVMGNAAVLHWNGRNWKVSKKVRNAIGLHDVTLLGEHGVLAVERSAPDSFVWRFDGRKWSRKKNSKVWLLSGASPRNVWSTALNEGVYRRTKGRWKRQELGGAVPAHKPCGNKPPCADVVWNGIVPSSWTRTWVFGYLRTQTKRAEEVETGLVLRRTGKTWKRLSAPRNWIPEQATADGTGGLWLSGKQLSKPIKEYDTYRTVTWHVTAKGEWQRLPALMTSEGPGTLFDMKRIPGTRRVIGVGRIFPTASRHSDESLFKAAVWSLTPN